MLRPPSSPDGEAGWEWCGRSAQGRSVFSRTDREGLGPAGAEARTSGRSRRGAAWSAGGPTKTIGFYYARQKAGCSRWRRGRPVTLMRSWARTAAGLSEDDGRWFAIPGMADTLGRPHRRVRRASLRWGGGRKLAQAGVDRRRRSRVDTIATDATGGHNAFWAAGGAGRIVVSGRSPATVGIPAERSAASKAENQGGRGTSRAPGARDADDPGGLLRLVNLSQA